MILSGLGLSYTQAGQLLGVSADTVRRWHRGATAISTERLATLAEVEDAIGRLTAMFLPERLPQVIRREADLFNGEAALAWILQGRIGEVADRYEGLLGYQA